MDPTATTKERVLNAPSGSGPAAEAGRERAQDAPNDAELDIFAAAREGKTNQIGALIEFGRARATDRDRDNITPLHWAAINGQVEACTYLIDQGADVNAVGGQLIATPLHWASRKGLVAIIDLLFQHGANPHLVDVQGYDCLHSVTHSSHYWALLYVLCRPGIDINERDTLDHTPLHWAVYQRDEVSTGILLKLGADPNVVDRDGLTPLHWAAFRGNKKSISQLLEAGADIRARNRERLTAEEMASRFNHSLTWNAAVGELGFKADGTRVRRPLSEPNVKLIIFLLPTVALCVSFTIASVFPWYMSILLSTVAFFSMSSVVAGELLQRGSIKDNIEESPDFVGLAFGTALWVMYAWVTRLRYDTSNHLSMHAAFLFFFIIFVLAFFCMVFGDPGRCVTPTKEDLKWILEDLVRREGLTSNTFCVRCLVVKAPPHTTHCSLCKTCISRHKISPYHVSWTMSCIGKKNHVQFLVFMVSLVAGILIFNYLVWTHLQILALKNFLRPARSCLLSHAVCKLMSADMFLISIAMWSTLILLPAVVTVGYYLIEIWKVFLAHRLRRLKSLVDRVVVRRT